MNRCAALVAVLVVLIGLPLSSAQQNFDQVEIQTVKVADGIFMLVGSGGNIGVCSGDDATFLIDDQYAPLTEKIRNAVSVISSQPIKFVLNTHWHGDHTGGNENLGEAGALIVAHENVRERMSREQFMQSFGRTVPASPVGALPVVTFNDSVTFHLNDEEIRAFHVDPAHTDGDSVVHFRKANVVHMGDLLFNGTYPFIDISSGGSFEGMIAAADRVLSLINDQTKIIPGHGPLADRSDLETFRSMLVSVRDTVKPMVLAGKSLEEVMESKPTSDFDEKWGQGFMNAETFLRIVYESLKNSQ